MPTETRALSEWHDIPEPVTWTLKESITHNGMTYKTITLRSPRGEEILKVTSLPGMSPTETTFRLLAEISGEKAPFEVIKQLPNWMLGQMGDYLGEFAGIPAPGPLERWRVARVARAVAGAVGERTTPTA